MLSQNCSDSYARTTIIALTLVQRSYSVSPTNLVFPSLTIPCFSHVIHRKIPIELTILCRFLELVIGSFIIACTYQRTGSLHGVTLPRSWIIEIMRKLHKLQSKDAHINVAWTTVQLFQDLLENVYTGYAAGERSIIRAYITAHCGSDHLHHQNKPLNAVPFRVRNFILARLCVFLPPYDPRYSLLTGLRP